MFTESLTPFFADFGQSATLAGSSVTCIFDKSTAPVFVGDSLTLEPSALLSASDASSAAAGQTFVTGSVTYTVRQVLEEPPDGALVRLVLVRA